MLPKARLRFAKGGSSALLIKPMRSLNLSGAKAKRETAEPFINDYILASLNSFQKQTTKPQGGEIFIASRLQTAPIELSEMPRISLNSKDLLMPPVFYKHCVPNGTFSARLSDHDYGVIDLV